MTIPTYLPYFVFAGALAAVTTILYGLNRALADAAWPPADRTRAFRVSAAILIGWLALSIAAGGDGRLPCGRKRHPHHPIRHRPAHSDRRPAALAIRHGGTRHRCRAATMADRRTALPRARRDLSHSLRCGESCRPCSPGRQALATSLSACSLRSWASPMRELHAIPLASSEHGTCSASWISSLPSRPAS